MTDWNKYPLRHPDTAFRKVGDEGGLVVLAGRSEVKVLNPVGIRIFSMLDGAHSRDEIVETIVEEFEVDAAQATRDLDDFLRELGEQGMMAGSESVSAREG